MRWRTFIVGWLLVAAVLLLAQRRSPDESPEVNTAVVELTYARPAMRANAASAPDLAQARRVVAPLAVFDITAAVRGDRAYTASMEDVARWEQAHGHIPVNAVVMAHSAVSPAWKLNDSHSANRFPGFSDEAVRFLVEARSVYGLGTDTPEHPRSVVVVYRGANSSK
ncbi:MAG: cyclase family protein [Terriglobales bacterium]